MLPMAWAAVEVTSHADVLFGGHDGIAYAIVAVAGAAVILLSVAHAAAAWSLVRRVPLRRPAWVVTATVIGLALLMIYCLFHAGLLIFLLGD